MQSYGDYPQESIEWWEQHEIPLYDKNWRDFEWGLIDEDYDDNEEDEEEDE
jgi:hypothetical protein